MKTHVVVRTDNFGRSGEQPGCDERVVVETEIEESAVRIANILNDENTNPDTPDFYESRKIDSKLAVFAP